MKTSFLIIFSIIATACADNQANRKANGPEMSKADTLIKEDSAILSTLESDWQLGFGLTHDPNRDSIWFKPVKYYISDRECSPIAIDFYYGRLRPGDDDLTDELLKLATTDNDKLRPFYRWCLNKTILIQDGALAEHTGIPARKYVEKFPKDFFGYIGIDPSGQKYNDWISAIEYSGFYDIDDYRKPKEIRVRMMNTMKANCKNCDSKTIKRIEEFAKECFD